jgi:hypothetical protein
MDSDSERKSHLQKLLKNAKVSFENVMVKKFFNIKYCRVKINLLFFKKFIEELLIKLRML